MRLFIFHLVSVLICVVVTTLTISLTLHRALWVSYIGDIAMGLNVLFGFLACFLDVCWIVVVMIDLWEWREKAKKESV